MKKIIIPVIFFCAALFSCAQKEKVDLLVYHATIYTVDSAFSTADAMAIKDGKILATGTRDSLEKIYSAKESWDAGGKFIFPGFIDAHAHFAGYALGLAKANLTGTGSWHEVLEILKTYAKENPEGWLIGRGWDQNDWDIKSFPVNDSLNVLFPDRPVILTRIDGHAAIANQKALELAGVSPEQQVKGGVIQNRNGHMTGVLVDNAVDLVTAKIPPATGDQLKKALKTAEQNCLAVGLTTIDDCGLPYNTIEQIRRFQDSGEIKMRLYIMLSDEAANYIWAEKNGMIKTDRLNVRSFKVYGDGALGSRGACLLQPYHDDPKNHGFLLSSAAHFDSVAAWLYKKGWQMCTHAIGDSGNRVILDIYTKYLGHPNDLRWRIEHAQVINKDDMYKFLACSIIPSVQPTHATSDMYWAQERLGAGRMYGAYAYGSLLRMNDWIALGTDFPVEDISPFKTFYAAYVRKDAKGWPAAGFQINNGLTREETIRGMTIWAAKANFEEKEKGSLEKGKWADFVVLDGDLMQEDPSKLLSIQVLRTYIAGEKLFSRN